jgi:hypothetical protein
MDVEMRQQLPGVPGVLGSDEIDLFEYAQRSQCDVFEVAYRSAYYINCSSHDLPCLFHNKTFRVKTKGPLQDCRRGPLSGNFADHLVCQAITAKLLI